MTKAYGIHTDFELAVLMKGGDPYAFTEIYNRYKPQLYTYALNKLRNREEAQDIIQEVFTYLWKKREMITFKRSLSGYLYGAVRHAVLNILTHKNVQEKYRNTLPDFSAYGISETDHLVRERQLQQVIAGKIEALPLKMREVFELSRIRHLSHKNIAHHLGISEETVSKQISNAIRILKVKLEGKPYNSFYSQSMSCP
jgi:RNA polymerase sigma-70 factor (family 1)